MSKLKKNTFTLYIATLTAVSAANCYIVTTNYKNDTYPIEQDSISIPIFFIIGALITLLTLSTFQLPFSKSKKDITPPTLISTALALISTTASAALLLMCIVYWLSPNHFVISALYITTLSTYLIHQLKLYKGPFRNYDGVRREKVKHK